MKKSSWSRSTITTAAIGVVVLGLLAPTGSVRANESDQKNLRTTLSSSCIDSSVPLSVEESRLNAKLPKNSNPALLQRTPFAMQMIEGAGFDSFGPRLVNRLCSTRNLRSAERLVEKQGKKLWRKAVKRVQKRHGRVAGDLPQSDDRPLYWARLQATAVLRQWEPRFALSIDERDALITSFDKASRGMTSIRFQPGNPVKRVIVSGFDPYTLDGGDDGSAQGAAGNNIRHGNPSGAVALALDGTTHRAKNGTRQVVQAYMLPVNYTEFAAGYLEDTVGPLMKARPNRRVDASLTISQAGGSEFHLEQWNARYHGVSPGNDLSQPCPRVDGTPQLAINNHGCNSEIPRRWGAPLGFNLDEPPQWTTASMPVGRMIRANTGRNVPRPPVIPGLTLRSPSVSSGTPTTPSSPIAPRRNEKAEARPYRPIRLLILQYHLTRTHVRTAVVGATISRTRAPTATPDCGITSAWISPPDTSTPPGCSTSTKAIYSSPATAPSMPGAMQLSRRR